MSSLNPTSSSSATQGSSSSTDNDHHGRLAAVAHRLESSISATAGLLAGLATTPSPVDRSAMTRSIVMDILPSQQDALDSLRAAIDQRPATAAPAAIVAPAPIDANRVNELELQVNDLGTQLADRDQHIAQLEAQHAQQVANLQSLVLGAETISNKRAELLAHKDRLIASLKVQVDLLGQGNSRMESTLQAAAEAMGAVKQKVHSFLAQDNTAQLIPPSLASAAAAVGPPSPTERALVPQTVKGDDKKRLASTQPLDQVYPPPSKQRRMRSRSPTTGPIMSESSSSSSASTSSTTGLATIAGGLDRSISAAAHLSSCSHPAAATAISYTPHRLTPAAGLNALFPPASDNLGSTGGSSRSAQSASTAAPAHSNRSVSCSQSTRPADPLLLSSDPTFPIHEPLSIPTGMQPSSLTVSRLRYDPGNSHPERAGQLQLHGLDARSQVVAHVLMHPICDQANPFLRALHSSNIQALSPPPLAAVFDFMLASDLGTPFTHAQLREGLASLLPEDEVDGAVHAAWLGPVFRVATVSDGEKQRQLRSRLLDQAQRRRNLTSRQDASTIDLDAGARWEMIVCMGLECVGLEYPVKESRVPAVEERVYMMRERYALVVQEEMEGK